MFLTVNNTIENNNNHKGTTLKEQIDVSSNENNKEQKAFQSNQKSKEIKQQPISIINIISRNNHNNTNQTDTIELSFASGLKKSTYTLLSERAIDHLFNTGQLPDNLNYDSLIKGKTPNTTHHSVGKHNTKAKKQKQKEKNKTTINKFLSKNNLDRNNKIKTQFNYRLSSDLNNTNKSSFGSVKDCSTNKNLKKLKTTIRSPLQFQNDQTKFINQKKKKIDELRKTIQDNMIKENRSKPIISLKSIEIVERASSENANKKKEEIHTRLYEDMKQRAISKEKAKQTAISLHQNLINQRVLSQNDINVCVHKLYQQGVEQLKTKNKNDTFCHMEKVNLFYSRDYSSYQSNIRTNSKKEMTLINNDSTSLKEQKDMNNVSQNNKMILIRKLNQEIDIALGEKNEDKTLDTLCVNQYCCLLFKLGLSQYNHICLRKYIKNCIEHDNCLLTDYNPLEIALINLEEITNTKCISSKEITKQKLIQEQKLLYKSWKLLCEYNSKQENECISLQLIKLLLFCIIGFYIGEKSNEKSKHQEKVSEPNAISSIKNHKSKENKVITYEQITKHCFKSSNDIMEYCIDEDKAKSISRSFRKLARNRHKFELNNLSKSKKDKLIDNYSFNPDLTFKPSINVVRISNTKLKVEESYDVIQKRKQNNIEKLQKEKELNELKDCTFTPNNRPNRNRRTSEISNRLYSYNKSTKRNKKQTNASKNKGNNNKQDEYTFSPKINKQVNESIFHQKSIRSDPVVSNKIKQYEKARIEKKLIGLLSEKGRTGLSYMRTSENMLKEIEKKEQLKSFQFDLEKKQCKDTFDTFTSNEQKNKNDYHQREQPVFTIEVKIKDRIELLNYYKNDDPELITQQFCKRNNLGESSNEKIYSVIKEKLKTNDI